MVQQDQIVEMRLTGDLDLAGALGDMDEAITNARILREDDWPTLIAECEGRAREIVASNWDAINAVEDALLASPTSSLGGDDVQRLTQRPPGR
jgi:hypothetical protein